MAEETEGQVVEQSVESVETSAPPAEATTPITSEDVWESPLVFPDEEAAVENESVSETPPTPESGQQTDGENEDQEQTEAPEQAEEAQEEIVEDAPEIDLKDIDPDRPAPLSRRKREEVVKSVIEPFRDPNVPPEEVFSALYQLNPERAEDLARTVAELSAKTHPDLWLQEILGAEVTVDEVKAKLAGTPHQAQQETDAFAPVVQALNEVYGEQWRDPANDAQILDEDLQYVKAMRAHLEEESVRAANEALKDKELDALKEKLQQLEPQINEIKTEQQAKFERDVEEAYLTSVKEYRTAVEQKSLDKLFTESGLTPSESDTEEVKALKDLIRTRFDRDQSSDFDHFISTQFSDTEKISKAVQRVDKHLSQAANAELLSKTERDKAKAEQYALKARAHRSEAAAEQDALRVLHRKAAQEYLQKLSPMMNVLKENAQLKTQLSRTRPEILGSQSAPVTDLKQRIQEAEDPWGREGWDALSVGR